MKRLRAFAFCVATLLAAGIDCKAGLRSPGEYCGVVVFDRWDGCTLYSGVYVMYVSEKTKEGLRQYAGEAVKIDAKEVWQRKNPGDGLIGKFNFLGPAPESSELTEMEGVVLESSIAARQDGKPVASMTIWNKRAKPATFYSSMLALTLLTRRDAAERSWSVSDGPSFALITRNCFFVNGSDPCWENKGVYMGVPYSWSIGRENALPHDFILAPGERKRIDILLDIPDGDYDFLCGYGGGVHEGKCLASNLSAFDVKGGKAEIVEIKGRK